jgi:hypothetical protein
MDLVLLTAVGWVMQKVCPISSFGARDILRVSIFIDD